MTTIAYKDGVIAYDSRLTNGNLIATDDFDKMTIRGDVIFILSGTPSDIDAFVDDLLAGDNKTDTDTCGFMIDAEGVGWRVGGSESPWKLKLWPNAIVAVGSGQDFAMAAMDLGHSAEEAVRYAATRDCKTGGRIRVFDCNKGLSA